MRMAAVCVVAAALAGCGGGGPDAPRTAYAEGPVQAACLRADRRSASQALCGCVQAAANASLSRRDRRRAAGFFGDPAVAQEVRQSDRPADEAFWRRYRVFVDQAERLCR